MAPIEATARRHINEVVLATLLVEALGVGCARMYWHERHVSGSYICGCLGLAYLLRAAWQIRAIAAGRLIRRSVAPHPIWLTALMVAALMVGVALSISIVADGHAKFATYADLGLYL